MSKYTKMSKYTISSFSVWCTCGLQSIHGTANACRNEAKCQEAIFVCSFVMNSKHYFVLLDQAIAYIFNWQLCCAHTLAVAEGIVERPTISCWL